MICKIFRAKKKPDARPSEHFKNRVAAVTGFGQQTLLAKVVHYIQLAVLEYF